jgi:hypothetical protein
MTRKEAKRLFQKIRERYDSIEPPKYRHVDPEDFKAEYERLVGLREYLKGDRDYLNLVNSMSQINKKLAKRGTWRNISERGINKAIPAVVGRMETETVISPENGRWGARQYMVMDIIGFFLLLEQGGDVLPDRSQPIFDDLEAVRRREAELGQTAQYKVTESTRSTVNEQDLVKMKTSKYGVKFDDGDFRKFASLGLSSNEILHLLLETSRAKFKVIFPVRLQQSSKKAKEELYPMNFFSPPFELSYIDKKRMDGIVQGREYYVLFDTFLGELFVHNLKSRHYDWLESSFYHLPYSAQVFYRKFLIHHDFPETPINLETIRERLGFQDRNVTNLVKTIEHNVLEPLKQQGLILGYERKEGLHRLKYIVKKPRKAKP